MARLQSRAWVAFAFLATALPGETTAEEPPLASVGCLIQPYETIEFSPSTAGIVARVLVERGDAVQKGDILVEFDARAEEIALELAVAKAEDRSRHDALVAKRRFLDEQAGRATDLVARRAGSRAAASEAQMEAEVAARDIDQEIAALAQAELERRSAEVTLDRRKITAPMDGIITERRLSAGEHHDNQKSVLTLARLDRLRIEAFAPISHAGRISAGQQVTIHPEAPIGGAWPAQITIVDQVFDAATATFGFRMEMANPDLALPAGLRCEVDFAAIAGD